MIQIKRSVINQIEVHAKADLPNEACGYLAAKDGIIGYVYQLTNIDHSPEHFSFDPKEQFLAVKDARSKGLEIVANYHSHPASPARPSVEDIRLAYDPNILYFIVSLEAHQPVLKAFQIRDGKVSNEEISIIE